MEEKKYSAEEALNLQSSAYQKGYNEGYQLGKSEIWVKATRENMRRSAILRDSVLHENNIHQWVINGWDEKGVLFTNKVFKEWWELEILDESGAAAGREEVLQRIKDFSLSDVDAPVFTHTKEFRAHFSYIKGKLMDIIKKQ